jgi:hypothetical protein
MLPLPIRERDRKSCRRTHRSSAADTTARRHSGRRRESGQATVSQERFNRQQGVESEECFDKRGNPDPSSQAEGNDRDGSALLDQLCLMEARVLGRVCEAEPLVMRVPALDALLVQHRPPAGMTTIIERIEKLF